MQCIFHDFLAGLNIALRTVGKRLDELVGVVVMHALPVREEVEVPRHALDGAAQLAVLELEVLAPEVEELLHLFLRQLGLPKDSYNK